MDFGRIITRAWEITWRWKVLWILGFLAALAGGGPNLGNSGYRFGGGQNPSTGLPNFNMPTIPTGLAGLFVGLACLAVIAGIVIWVLAIIARGGLIAGVVQAEDEGTVSLGHAWETGVRRFWTLFGIDVLVALPMIVLVLLAIGGVVLAFVPVATSSGGNAPAYLDRNAPLIVSAVCCLCTLICGLVIVGIVLGQIRIYAERAAILEGLGWTAAFGRGWRVLREHLGPTVIFWLIMLVVGIVVGVVILIVLSPLAIPLIAIFSQNQAGPGWWLALCGGGLIALVVGALISSVVQVFTSATWTLAYRGLTGAAGAAAVGAEPPGAVVAE